MSEQGAGGFRETAAAAMVCAALLFAGRAVAGQGGEARADCRIDAGPCVKAVQGITATFDVTPRPVSAMRELLFSVTLEERGGPVTDAAVTVELTMPGMYMGTNRVRLARKSGGLYAGKGIIVRCPSGKKVWQAQVDIKRSNQTSFARYVFEVH